ncbi:MAG: KpsF/GutQ family sugar-phosphate isomerase [Desulfobacterota bacterium]|nr:KpsF/GutQ family sugar-phosphate isomerase [Thermodesulfobacteriota bacterium]MDW8001936.1 KpsF/GutQ family sugar-phosphate isomerase [Deltaproteobacteria bacterium]
MDKKEVDSIVKLGKEVLKKEAEAILKVMEELDENFYKAVQLIESCKGRIIVSGMGKSGIICKKIAATLTSIGSPAIFLHPADSLHGDLGMLRKGDCVVIVSRSGETEEIIRILPLIKRIDLSTIVITGNMDSTIAKYGDVVLKIDVDEACPFNIIPTSSTTASLALGDAIAVAIMAIRKVKLEDFACFHPGGTIGRKLLLKVEDLMHTGDEMPKVYQDTLMKDTILEITSKRLGVTGVYNRNEELVGVITDGDLRRGIEKYKNQFLEKTASEVMTSNPKTILKESLATDALKKMEHYAITSLFVLEKEGDKRPVGIIHIHDLLKAKIV